MIKESVHSAIDSNLLKDILNEAVKLITASSKNAFLINCTVDKTTMKSGKIDNTQEVIYTHFRKDNLLKLLTPDFFIDKLNGISVISMAKHGKEDKFRIIASYQDENENKERFSHTLELVIEL